MGLPDARSRRPRAESGDQDERGDGYVTAILANPSASLPVAAKLLRLRWHYGYFSRTELEDAFGLPRPHGRWQCNGQFGPDGRWQHHCCGIPA